MKGLFTEVLARTLNISKAIVNHPFNQELASGSLSFKRFSYYVEQDYFYLEQLSRCYDLLAAKSPYKYAGNFLKYANYTLLSEQEMLHKFLATDSSFEKTGLTTKAAVDYTGYLLHNCANESLEVGAASLLPCFVIYHQIAISSGKNSIANNPYKKWIEAYLDSDFAASVKQSVETFNELASNSDEATRQKMINVYRQSCHFEFNFFDDAYYLRSLSDARKKDLLLIPSSIVQTPDASKPVSLSLSLRS